MKKLMILLLLCCVVLGGCGNLENSPSEVKTSSPSASTTSSPAGGDETESDESVEENISDSEPVSAQYEPENESEELGNEAEEGQNFQEESIETYMPTTGEANALKSAKNYLSIMPFSYDGLIGQLV